MSGIIPATVMLIVLFSVALVLALGLFSETVAEVSKQTEETKKIEGASTIISHAVTLSKDTVVALENCATDAQKTVFNYKFRVSGKASFEGQPGETEKMPVFITLTFGSNVVRDTKNTIINLKPGKEEPFVELGFEIQSSKPPFILKPEDSGFQGIVKVGQSVVVNNYRITPKKQFGNTLFVKNCYTTFRIECADRPKGITLKTETTLTSRKEDPNDYKDSVVACGNRVDLEIGDYQSGTCNSRPVSLIVQTSKKAEDWDYADVAVINVWHKDAEKPLKIQKEGRTTEEVCWQQSGISENCRDKFHGFETYGLGIDTASQPLKLVPEKYNVVGCV